MIRVRELDPQTQKPGSEVELHFKPGPFAWGEGEAHLNNLADLALSTLAAGRLPTPSRSGEILSQPDDPFRLIVQKYLPAAAPAIHRHADPAGEPMARIQLEFKATGNAARPSGFHHPWTSSGSSSIGGFIGLPEGTPLPWSRSRMSIGRNWWKISSSPRLIQARTAWPGFATPASRVRFWVHDLALEGQEGKTVSCPAAISR